MQANWIVGSIVRLQLQCAILFCALCLLSSTTKCGDHLYPKTHGILLHPPPPPPPPAALTSVIWCCVDLKFTDHKLAHLSTGTKSPTPGSGVTSSSKPTGSIALSGGGEGGGWWSRLLPFYLKTDHISGFGLICRLSR